MRSVDCPAGKWTILLDCVASGMPADWTVAFRPSDGGQVAGRYRETRGFLPFGIGAAKPVEGPLREKQQFSRGWFDASYRLEVWPEADLVAEIR